MSAMASVMIYFLCLKLSYVFIMIAYISMTVVAYWKEIYDDVVEENNERDEEKRSYWLICILHVLIIRCAHHHLEQSHQCVLGRLKPYRMVSEKADPYYCCRCTERQDELKAWLNNELTMKKNTSEYFALLIVSKSTPNPGNCVVSTLRFLIDIKTMQTEEIWI